MLQAESEFGRCISRRGEALSLMNASPPYGHFPSIYYYEGRSREADVLNRHAVLRRSRDDFIRLHRQHAGVIGSLQDHQRELDLRGMKQRRDPPEALRVGLRVPELRVECAACASSPRRYARERARPVRDAE